MRDNVEAESPEDYFRKSITVPFLYCTLNEMKTSFTDIHARTALGLQLVPSIIENIAPQLSPLPVNKGKFGKLQYCKIYQTQIILITKERSELVNYKIKSQSSLHIAIYQSNYILFSGSYFLESI